MKKLFIISVPIIIGAVIFCTQSFAGDNGKEKKNKEHLAKGNLPAASTLTCTFCCVNAGVDQTVTCGTSKTIGTSNANLCVGSCSGNFCPTSWSWAPATYLSCTNCAQPVVSPTCPAPGSSITYTLTVSRGGCGGGCADATDQVKVTFNGCCNACCRIGYFAQNEEVKNKNIKLFPNPTTGKITVEIIKDYENAVIQVYNINGELVKEMPMPGNNGKTMEIDLSNESKGIYFIQLISNQKGLLNKKILIQ